VEPVSEEVEETSREGESAAHEAPFPGISEEDPDEQDSFKKLLAEMELEIEEEADIGFGEEVGSVANISKIHEDSSYTALNIGRDVRTDHPTSIPNAGVVDFRKTQCTEEVLPTEFSEDTQEAPSCVAEWDLEELNGGNRMPITPSISPRENPSGLERGEEILYTDSYIVKSESALGLDNDEVQRYMNLEEIFSFLRDDNEETYSRSCHESTTSSSDNESIHTGIEELTLTDENDVTNIEEENSGNEFSGILENEPKTGRRNEGYNNLGGGDYPPTSECPWKKNLEEKVYFHVGRGVKLKDHGDACPLTESRPTMPIQQETTTLKLSSRHDSWSPSKPTKQIRNTLATIGHPMGYQNSRMRKFNHHFGYKTRKHPIACHQSDICRWLTNNKIKECCATQHPTRSISNDPYPVQNTNPESYAPNIKLLSSTTSLTGAQKQPCDHFMLETSPGNTQEDEARHDVISSNGDRKLERHPPLAANDQRELPSDACQSPIIGHGDMHDFDRAVLPPVRLEIDKRERRYSNDGHDVNVLHHVVVQSTRLSIFPSDAYEKCYVCSEQGETGDNSLPPCIEQPQHVEIAEEDQSQSIGLNESVDLFPDESQRSPPTTGNGKPSSIAYCSIPSVQSISSAWLHVSSATTGSPEEMRSNRETASPPCMTSGETGYPKTTEARRTRTKHLKGTYENISTGNGKSNKES